ncbi:MAG: sensor histidine kinase [Cyanobacteria bacterium J06554_11]
MGRAIQLHNHPFRFLLYLEWGLLAVALFTALESPPGRMARRAAREPLGTAPPPPPPPIEPWHATPLLAIIAIVVFGLMGLYLPANRLAKMGHTLGQILLILLASATVFNGGRTFPFIYLLLVIRGCLMFGLTGRLIVTGVAFLLFVVGLSFRLRSLSGMGRRLPSEVHGPLQHLVMGLHLNFVVLFGLSLLLVVLLINALLTERQSQQKLQRANRELRGSAQEIEKLAMDQERSRIARDIHDALGHSLTALNVQLESAVKLWEKDPNRSQQFLLTAKQLGSQSLQEVRASVASLRQDPLAGKSLASAISSLLQTAQSNQASPLTITHDIDLAQPLASNLNLLLYRIVQEGLTNVVKHANAQNVHLQLTGSPAVVTLQLEDDGDGFDIQQARSGFGLQSMRDRAEAVGGTFKLTSRQTGPRKGTRIQVSLPVGTVPT